MNLAKWLVVNKSIRQIGGGSSRFVLPVSTASRADIKSVLYPRLLEKESSRGVREIQKENPERKEIIHETLTTARQVESNRNVETEVQNRLGAIEQKTAQNNQPELIKEQPIYQPILDDSARNPSDNQMTLDDWLARDNAPTQNKENTPASTRFQIGRWALKRGLQKAPKPTPIQSEFRLKSVEVVRNELNYSDIEIIAKPVKGKFARFLSNTCSLISNGIKKLLSKLRI